MGTNIYNVRNSTFNYLGAKNVHTYALSAIPVGMNTTYWAPVTSQRIVGTFPVSGEFEAINFELTTENPDSNFTYIFAIVDDNNQTLWKSSPLSATSRESYYWPRFEYQHYFTNPLTAYTNYSVRVSAVNLPLTAGDGVKINISRVDMYMVPTATPTPTPTPTPSYTPYPECRGHEVAWTAPQDCDAIKFYRIYRACSQTEYFPPLSAYSPVETIYNLNQTKWIDWDLPCATICYYIVATGNPRTVTFPQTAWMDRTGTLAPSSLRSCSPSSSAEYFIAPLHPIICKSIFECTPTPTPSPECMQYDFRLGDPGIKYQKCFAYGLPGVMYIRCVTRDPNDHEDYPPAVTPIPISKRPYCATPTPTPTVCLDEFDECGITPTPTPTPTISPSPTPTPTPSPSPPATKPPVPTPTPTPTCPCTNCIYVRDDTGNDEATLVFAEAHVNDRDYVSITYKTSTGVTKTALSKRSLPNYPGRPVNIPIMAGETVYVTIRSDHSGMYPPTTIDVYYDNVVKLNNIFLETNEIHTFEIHRRF